MKYLILFIAFYNFNCFSQTNDTIKNKKNVVLFNFKSSLDTTTIKKINFNYDFKIDNYQTFIIYNKNTKWNDAYYISKNNVSIKPFNFSSNQFSNIDSLNPYGTTDIKAGIIVGALNAIIGKCSFKF